MAVENRPHLTQFIGETLIDMWPRGPEEQYILMFSNRKKLVFGTHRTPYGYCLPTIEVEEP